MVHKRLQTLVLLAVWGFSAEVLFAQNKAQPASFETLGVQALLNEAPDLTGLSVSIGLVELDQVGILEGVRALSQCIHDFKIST